MVFLFIQRTGSRILVFDEWYYSKQLPDEAINDILQKCIHWFGYRGDDQDAADDIPKEEREPKKLPSIACGSPEAKVLQRHLRAANIPVRCRRVPTVIEGINNLRQLVKDGKGHRSLQIHSRCRNTIDELSSGYVYPKGKRFSSTEKPEDKNNHAADSLRDWAWVRARV